MKKKANLTIRKGKQLTQLELINIRGGGETEDDDLLPESRGNS